MIQPLTISQERTVEDQSLKSPELRESPYTIPNALTLSRLLACPLLGYHIVQGNIEWATGILLVSGFTDWVRQSLAQRVCTKV